MPGVPGIGVKTAAQLIVEYGDLETLLLRAGEIKQPKRREALIEHADKARISRQLVLLDDKVDLDVPLDELAVHEPDARKLIAFLKAMEFSTLTRRVAEYSQVDPSDIEAATDVKSPFVRWNAGGFAVDGIVRRRTRRCGEGHQSFVRAGELPLGDGEAAASSGKADRGTVIALTPQALATSRAEAARKTKIDRDKYQTVRSLDQLNAWIARIHDVGHVAVDAKATSIDPMQAEMCGIALALGPNDACYIPLSHKQSGDGAGLFAAGLAPGPDQGFGRTRRAAADAGIGRAAQDRLQHQILGRDAGAARHRHPQP